VNEDHVERIIAAWQTQLPEVLYPTSELTKRIMVLAGELDEATRRVLRDLELTTAEFDVIVALRRQGTPYRQKPSDLSRSLLLSSGGTSNVTNQLVRRGLVAREPDPDDGRGTQIRLTPAGIALAEKAVKTSSEAHHRLWAGVPDETLDGATQALRALFRARS
jgi:DNA-binding MarR family transcriptional regulator